MDELKTVNTEKAPAAIGPYSQAIKYGDLVFTSGQIPVDPENGSIPEGIGKQAELALNNLANVLTASGASLESVVKTTCFLASMDDFGEFNKVYSEFFTGTKPGRSCVAVAALPKGVLCEIEAIAVTA